jgi:hypothetical protein
MDSFEGSSPASVIAGIRELDAIETLLQRDTAGNPITGVKWTRKATEKIAAKQIDIPASASTVARPVYQTPFSLRVNRKQVATNSSPYRDRQLSTLALSGSASNGKACPSSASTARSVEGSATSNAGAKWDRSPVLLSDHDFLSDASGVSIPSRHL